jgi:hypothetical protein
MIYCSLRKVHMLSRYSDSLRAGRSGDRIAVGARDFFASVQTGPVAYPASSTMGTGLFPGVKRPGRGADYPPPTSAEVKGRVELYLYSPSGPSWPVLGKTLPYLRPCLGTLHCVESNGRTASEQMNCKGCDRKRVWLTAATFAWSN